MNEASRIVSQLQRNLAELDQKVKLYRRDMASEFEKYTENLLQNVSSDVSETVTRTMTESRKGYPLLHLDDTLLNYSYTSDTSNRKEKLTLEPVTLRRSLTDPCKKSDPRNLNEHDVELQGLFTPNYLPLLDHSSRERKSALPRSPTKRYVDKGSGSTEDFLLADASTEVTRSLTPSPLLETRAPTLKRRLTDGTSSNSGSSDRETRRRSALRQASSSPKAENESPRRVRFDVAGKEVLPTSSPSQTVRLIFDDLSSDIIDSDDNTESEIFDDTYESAPPNRISSSQALRLLSRKSLEDDGTIWTTVGSTSEESSPTSDQAPESRPAAQSPQYSPPRALSLNQITLRRPEMNDNATIEEDLYSLRPKSRGESRSQNFTSMKSSNIFGRNLVGSANEDEEELFNFDETTLDPERHQRFTHQTDSDEEEEDNFLTIKSSKSRSNQTNSQLHLKSPALKIPMASTTTVPGTTNLCESILPKDHPFSIPIVRPEIHARAASLGPLDTFVGSVDGRTGLDESKAKNFIGSVGSPERSLMEKLRSGRSPKSLTERMLLEDLVEEDWPKTDVTNYAEDNTFNNSLEVELSGEYYRSHTQPRKSYN